MGKNHASQYANFGSLPSILEDIPMPRMNIYNKEGT